MRNAMNEVTRAAYVKDCEIGLKRWNMQIKRAGHDFQLTLPSTRFRRSIGAWANVPTDPQGRIIGREEYERGTARLGPERIGPRVREEPDAAR